MDSNCLQHWTASCNRKLISHANEYRAMHMKNKKTSQKEVVINILAKSFVTNQSVNYIIKQDRHQASGIFTYGEGNYCHPKKRGYPNGRMQLYIVSGGIINVDKYYLDDNGQKPGYEKWKWQKIL